jgi:hypothetical protein
VRSDSGGGVVGAILLPAAVFLSFFCFFTRTFIMQIEMKVAMDFVWDIRSKLRADGAKLWADGAKLRADGDKLWADGDKLRAEGDKLWAEAILAFAGNIEIEWIWRSDKNTNACKLESGEIFEP